MHFPAYLYFLLARRSFRLHIQQLNPLNLLPPPNVVPHLHSGHTRDKQQRPRQHQHAIVHPIEARVLYDLDLVAHKEVSGLVSAVVHGVGVAIDQAYVIVSPSDETLEIDLVLSFGSKPFGYFFAVGIVLRRVAVRGGVGNHHVDDVIVAVIRSFY